MVPKPTRLLTERLVLAPVDVRTARRVVAGRLGGMPVSPGWPHDETVEALAVTVERGDDAPPGWLVVRRLDRSIVGDCGWHDWPDGDGEVEIGYGLAEPARGQGLGTELCEAMLAWTWGQPGVRRVVARVRPDNEASRRLLRRLGFREAPDVPNRFVLARRPSRAAQRDRADA